MLQIKIQRIDNIAKVNINGDTVDFRYGPIPEIVDLIEKGVNKLLVNLSGVDYFTSAGISALIATTKMARDFDISLGIYNLQAQAKESIERTGMMKLLPIFETELEAANSVGVICEEPGVIKQSRVLIIENDLEVSKIIFGLFDECKNLANYNIATKKELHSAYRFLVDKDETNLILMDVSFDPVDVQDFLKKLRNNKKLNQIPVVVLTDDENVPRGYYFVTCGASDILRLPLNRYELETRIRFALDYFQHAIQL